MKENPPKRNQATSAFYGISMELYSLMRILFSDSYTNGHYNKRKKVLHRGGRSVSASRTYNTPNEVRAGIQGEFPQEKRPRVQ